MDRELIKKVQELRKAGKSFGEISKELLITKSNACYCNKINLDEYDEKKSSHQKYINSVCELAKKCTNINQILHILGKKGTNEYYKQIRKILEENKIDTSHFNEYEPYKPEGIKDKIPIEKYLIKGSTITISKLRERLLKEGIKEHKCENPECGLTEWHNMPIPLQLHHINGDRTDNRLENLQLLCPNCHALTDNYCGKKLKEEKNKCKICGKEISKKAEYCTDCYHSLIQTKGAKEYKKYHHSEKRPNNKEELIEAFKECGSFSGVGRKYGVSDKGVIKWFSYYELPTSSLKMRDFVRNYYNEDIKWSFNSGNTWAFREYQAKNFKSRALLDNDGNIEKIYNSLDEIRKDGFDPKVVYKVCNGILKAHKGRIFKFVN